MQFSKRSVALTIGLQFLLTAPVCLAKTDATAVSANQAKQLIAKKEKTGKDKQSADGEGTLNTPEINSKDNGQNNSANLKDAANVLPAVPIGTVVDTNKKANIKDSNGIVKTTGKVSERNDQSNLKEGYSLSKPIGSTANTNKQANIKDADGVLPTTALNKKDKGKNKDANAKEDSGTLQTAPFATKDLETKPVEATDIGRPAAEKKNVGRPSAEKKDVGRPAAETKDVGRPASETKDLNTPTGIN